MTFADRLKQIRVDAGLTQEAIGAAGFITAAGWIKLENDQREASERLIDNLVNWLVADKHIPAANREPLRAELLTLKYLGGSGKSPFLRELAASHARNTPAGQRLLEAFVETRSSPRLPARRGRPPLRRTTDGAAAASPRKGGS